MRASRLTVSDWFLRVNLDVPHTAPEESHSYPLSGRLYHLFDSARSPIDQRFSMHRRSSSVGSAHPASPEAQSFHHTYDADGLGSCELFSRLTHELRSSRSCFLRYFLLVFDRLKNNLSVQTPSLADRAVTATLFCRLSFPADIRLLSVKALSTKALYSRLQTTRVLSS